MPFDQQMQLEKLLEIRPIKMAVFENLQIRGKAIQRAAKDQRWGRANINSRLDQERLYDQGNQPA